MRETKVHYSPSEKDGDGVFVVEAARGADSTPGITKPHIPMAVAEEDLDEFECQGATLQNGADEPQACSSGTHLPVNNEEVLVHQPPNGMRYDDDVLMVDEDGAVSMSSPKLNGNGPHGDERAIIGNANTGLSQSDLSISSSTGSNHGYSYGNQQPYTVDGKVYPNDSPRFDTHAVNATKHSNPINETASATHNQIDCINSKPVITDAIYKTDKRISAETTLDDEANIVLDEIENDEFVDTIPLTEIPAPVGFGSNDNYHVTNKMSIQENGFPKQLETIPETNGKYHADDVNDNGTNGIESNDFDSLVNLPAPPSCDEIIHMTDCSNGLDNGNLDSLPPPPPEISAGGPAES